MRKHLSLGLIATSAILTSGLAFAQSEAAPHEQSSPETGATTIPGQTASKDKPVQTAEEKAEQDKRILGVLPNYRTADGTKKFVPMDSKGKMRIAMKDSFDYPGFIVAAGLSLIYQAENQNPDFGQGMKGYAHRYGTGVADQIIGNMMTEGIMPSLLREDPRYFRKVKGSFMSRLGYSATRTLISRNDKGHNTVNFAELLGNSAASGIANLYYPHSRSVSDNLTRTATAISTDTISNILKEFWPDIKNYWTRRHSRGMVTP